jgi:outer membrane receptor protein involved in Fe transport
MFRFTILTTRANSTLTSRARTSKGGALLAFVFLVTATSAYGQETRSGGNGTVRGQVVDAQRGALPGVTVTAQSLEAAGVSSTVSDSEGKYELSLLPGRAYTVTADLSGFSTFARSEVNVDAGQSLTIDIQLQVGGLSETITVLGQEVTRSRNTIERVQDVPLSISIVPGAELEKTEATGIAAITQRVANVSWNFGNQRTSSLSIRGVGKQGQTEAQDPSVGVIVDGVNYAYNALTSAYDFSDVESVEVTRGPQGTLQGKNTSLGVINVITKRPSFTPSADASLTLGQLGTVLTRVAAGGPINNHLAWRGAFSTSKGNGDMYNTYNRDVTYTNLDRVSGRVQVLTVPTPRFSARLAADIQPRGSETTNGRTINLPTPTRYSNGTATNLTTDPSTRLARRWFTQNSAYSYAGNFLYGGADGRSVANDAARGLVTGSRGVSTELNWTLGGHTLTSISAYKTYHFNAVNDEGTPFDVQRNNGGFFNDYRQASEEVRLSSSRGRFLDYQLGLFYIDVKNDVDYQKIWGADAGAWYANPGQYNRLDASPAGRFLLQQSLAGLNMSWNSPTGTQHIRNTSGAPFAQANWHLTSALVLTTGARLSFEDRQNTGTTFIRENGFAPELNPAVVNGVPLGGFNSTPAGALAAANSLDQLTLADRTANKYFGATITDIPGGAYNTLTTAQKQQLADAKAIRAAQIGVVFNPQDADPFKASLPSFVVSPLYKINDQLNVYGSWQYGEKAGISQFVNGVSGLASAEESASYELGVKSVLFDRTLLVNADLFVTNITDYQQAVRVLDAYTTTLNNDGLNYYTTATGNVPDVRVKGVEVDGVFAAIRNLSIRFAGAYTDARYQSFPNSAQPLENGFTGAAPYQDVSGQLLPGAARFSFNIAPDVRIPFAGDKNIHASFNTAFISRYKSDNSLSEYSWIPAHSVTDLAVGFGKQRFEVNLIVKNLFNDRTAQTYTWNSYTPAVPRWIGVQFTGKL